MSAVLDNGLNVTALHNHFLYETARVFYVHVHGHQSAADITHRGDLCTFEAMCETFQLDEPALRSIARVVHDLDLKDGRFGAPEAVRRRLSD